MRHVHLQSQPVAKGGRILEFLLRSIPKSFILQITPFPTDFDVLTARAQPWATESAATVP
jgi:hypothetical protein